MNAASCVNGYCLDDAGACPEACDLFGHGRWVSTAGGGPRARDSTDPETTDPAPTGPGWHPVCDEEFAAGCIRCAQRLCCEELGACIDSEACVDYADCIDACAGSRGCEAECGSLYPLGASDFTPYDRCMSRMCGAACDGGFM